MCVDLLHAPALWQTSHAEAAGLLAAEGICLKLSGLLWFELLLIC